MLLFKKELLQNLNEERKEKKRKILTPRP